MEYGSSIEKRGGEEEEKKESSHLLKQRRNIIKEEKEQGIPKKDKISSYEDKSQDKNNNSNKSIFTKIREGLLSFFQQFKQPKVYSTAAVASAAVITLGTLGVKLTKEVTSNEAVRRMLNEHPFQIAMISGIGAPVVEELVYRKFIFGGLQRRGHSKLLAYGLSSFLFAFEHYGFNPRLLLQELHTNPISVPIFMTIGLILDAAYDRSGYILSTMLTHSINNTLSLLSIYFGYI